MEHLPGLGPARRLAHDTECARRAPLQLHQALAARAAADRVEERVGDRGLVERARRRIDDEQDLRPAARAVVPLDELPVRRPPPEARRHRLLEHADHVDVEESDAAGGQLLVRADVVQVQAPALPRHRAAAVAPRECRAVAHADVEQHERRGVEQRGEEHRVVGHAGTPASGPRLDQRMAVVEEVHVVGGVGMRACERQDVGLGRAHARQRDGPAGLDDRAPGRRRRLAAHREARAAELDARVGGRLADQDGGARVAPQVGRAAARELVGHPAHDRRGIVERRERRPRQGNAREQAARAHRAHAPAIARREPRRRHVDRREPAGGRAAALRELERIGDGRPAGDAVVRVRPPAPAVRLERDVRVDRVVAHEREVDRHRRAGAAAPAGRREAVHDGVRIHERRGVDGERQAAAHDRPPTLELVARQADARGVERRERSFDAFAAHRRRHVLLRAARVVEEPCVGRTRQRTRPRHACEEPRLATLEPLADDRPHRLDRERRREEARQRREEPQADGDVVSTGERHGTYARAASPLAPGSATSDRRTASASIVAIIARQSCTP